MQRIKEKAPRVRKVSLGILDMDGMLITLSGWRMRFLFSSLYTISKTTRLTYSGEQLIACLDLVPVCKLVYMRYDICDDTSLISQLARRMSPALQIINIWARDTVNISGFIRDPDNGKYLVYPSLRTLTLAFVGFSQRRPRPTFKGATPFSRLSNVNITISYPFGDDVVFRGHGATLKSLCLELDHESITLLKRHRVFMHNSRPKLQCVYTSTRPSFEPNDPTKVAPLRYAMLIAPAASVRIITDIPSVGFNSILPLALSTLRDNAYIQVLALPRESLPLWDALTLIKSLPLLSNVCAKCLTFGETSQAIIMIDLPGYVRSTFASMGKQFRRWYLTQHSEYNVGEVVTCWLLLALISPNFYYAVMYKDYRELFMAEMRKQIAEPWFSEHAPRLSRLLISAWR